VVLYTSTWPATNVFIPAVQELSRCGRANLSFRKLYPLHYSWPRIRGAFSLTGVRYDRLSHPMLQRTLPAGFIAPCLPTKTDKLPSGSQWLHEIKHDGFRIIARKTGAQVKLYSRPGNDLTRRFPLIVDALSRLLARLHHAS
jgi:ATP dependent DNA ligase domain